MKPNADLTTTQRLPVYETMADLVASDPARYYAHRVRIDHVIDLHKPPREWRIEGLLRPWRPRWLLRRHPGPPRRPERHGPAPA